MGHIYIVNKRCREENIKSKYPGAIILDVTSRSTYAKKLSPFYPHGNIPIPFSNGATAMSVEGIWQGLKVFETEDICMKSFQNDSMQNLKRTVRKLGLPKGHRKGINGNEILDYLSARVLIYLPTYEWVLKNVPDVVQIIEKIKLKSYETDIVLLDYNTNADYLDLSSPLSHACLIKLFIEDNYPRPNIDAIISQNHKINTTYKKKNSADLTPSLFEKYD